MQEQFVIRLRNGSDLLFALFVFPFILLSGCYFVLQIRFYLSYVFLPQMMLYMHSETFLPIRERPDFSYKVYPNLVTLFVIT